MRLPLQDSEVPAEGKKEGKEEGRMYTPILVMIQVPAEGDEGDTIIIPSSPAPTHPIFQLAILVPMIFSTPM
jgi:hypothetical protein